MSENANIDEIITEVSAAELGGKIDPIRILLVRAVCEVVRELAGIREELAGIRDAINSMPRK